MSKEKKQGPLKAFKVELLTGNEGESVLQEEPRHIINEIIMNTNAFVEAGTTDVVAMLYLGLAQKYAMRFVNPKGLIDPMQGTFAGIHVIWVEASYHVNLVARRDAPEQG